ncbi:MAG: 23S rRNA (adenine(2503)-C(2))-methyltransferase RlmN, partial [Nitrospirae bacterium]|nr:23S rRNA (adenine(2503)-C(2))-methyltransferase RlmN [Nitrospirota bacterium]
MERVVSEMGLPAFRSKQLIHWIYERYAESISDITELSKGLRNELSEKAYISNLTLLNRQVSRDGTQKFLFNLDDEETIESVIIPDKDRLTLCISSQVGCAIGCRFCLTGSLGLKRNLTAAEIVDQIISINRLIKPAKITNIVFMGMGEPLLNLENVAESLWRMTEFMKIPLRRITLSTSGIAPMIPLLPQKAPMVNLAISLNATNDKTRDYLMPIN